MVENYKNESLVDVAYSILRDRKDEISFQDLYNEVCLKHELNEAQKTEYVSTFFTNLSLDGRFVTLKNNFWDLRERHIYDKVHVDLNAIYEDIDQDSRESIDDEVDEDEKALHLGDEDDEEVGEEGEESEY